MCKAGSHTKAGQQVHNANERKLRRIGKAQLDAVVKGTADADEVVIAPISSPYTD